MFLGVIADDFTGGTDIASFLVKEGMATVQMIGMPMPLWSHLRAALFLLQMQLWLR